MRYVVRYFDATQTAVVEANVDATSEAELRAQWVAASRVLLSVRPIKATEPSVAGNSDFDISTWCQELRTLLGAGMTVVESIETLHAQSQGHGRRGAVHAALLQSLREGLALSRAMQASQAFPNVLVASVTASERTSTLVTALTDYLRYAELLKQLRKQAISAAIYPCIVVALGGLIAMFLLLYVIPRFSRMYVNFRGTVSGTTQALLVVSRALHEQADLIAVVMLAGVGLLVWAWRRGWMARMATALVEAIEPLRRQWDQFRLAKLYHSVALMFRGGYTLDEALTVCEGLGLGPRLTAGLRRTRSELARGRAASQSFAEGGLTETVSFRLLAVGERTGSFDAVLQTIAERHAQAFTTFIERATRIVEPLLLLIVALVVGGIVVMMYMPIFDIANGVH